MKTNLEKNMALKMIRENLLFHLGHFSAFTPNQRLKFIRKLKEFIDCYYRNTSVSNYILNHEIIKTRLPTIRKLCLLYEKDIEKQFVKDCLHGNCLKLNRYVTAYKKFLKIEGSMAEIKKTSEIIILGSGYLPGTALLLTDIFKAKCTCIDNDMNAVNISRKLIKKLSLDDKVSVEYGEVTKYPLVGYDIIFVTGSCVPKKDIFDHIFEEIEDAKVIYRNPLGLYKMFYTPSSEKEINKFKILNTIHHGRGYPFDSVLLTMRDAKL